jgi:hypothetical protein
MESDPEYVISLDEYIQKQITVKREVQALGLIGFIFSSRFQEWITVLVQLCLAMDFIL